jgi:hypothetical protein
VTTVHFLVFSCKARGGSNGLLLPPVWCFYCVLSTSVINTCWIQGSNPRENRRYFSSAKRPERLLGPPSLQFSEYQGSFPGIKRPELEVDHCPPPSAEVKNGWSCTSACTLFLYGVEGEYVIILPLPLSLYFRINIFLLSGSVLQESDQWVSWLCTSFSSLFNLQETRPDQTRPDQTRPDQTRPDQTRIPMCTAVLLTHKNKNKYKNSNDDHLLYSTEVTK